MCWSWSGTLGRQAKLIVSDVVGRKSSIVGFGIG